jgi:hypothetical protein
MEAVIVVHLSRMYLPGVFRQTINNSVSFARVLAETGTGHPPNTSHKRCVRVLTVTLL